MINLFDMIFLNRLKNSADEIESAKKNVFVPYVLTGFMLAFLVKKYS